MLTSLIYLILASCSSETQVSDFTKENEFTSGIEGPALSTKGEIYVVNFQAEGTIGIVSEEGNVSLWTALPLGSIGNSIQVQKNGSLLVADYVQHQVLKINPDTKVVSIFACDTLMNQPNDLAMFSDSVIFASDPDWKIGTGNLWRIEPGKCILLEDSMGTTNGITFSPDKKFLYVNESVQRKIWKYEVDDLGNISEKKAFHSFPDFGLDGMKCDRVGNLYVTRHEKGTIAVLSPEGKLMTEIVLIGKKPSNLVFDSSGKIFFVTLQDRGCLEKVRLE